MGMDWLDEKKVQEARQKAIQAGYKADEVDSFIQVNKAAAGIASGKSSLTLDMIPQDQRAAVDAALIKQGYTPETKKQKEAKEGKQKAATNAQQVLELLDKKARGEKIDDYDTQLAFLASEYNKKGFQEGGKALTAPERAILSGSMINVQDRVPRFWESFITNAITGKAVPTKSFVADNEKEIRTKMIKALEVSDPELAKKYKKSSKKEQNTIVDTLINNAKKDLMEMGQGVVDTGQMAVDTVKEHPFTAPAHIYNNMAKGMGEGIVEQAKEAAPISMENGRAKFDPGKTRDYAVENPIDTLLTLAPFLFKGAKFATGKVTGGGSKAVAVADEASVTPGISQVSPNLSNSLLGKVDEARKSFGENIRSNVREIEQPGSIYGAGREKRINQTMNKMGIKGSPTQQYEQLQPKVTELSVEISNELMKDPKFVNVDETVKAFKDNISKELPSQKINKKTINQEIKGYVQDLYGDRIGTEISVPELFELKQRMNRDFGTIKKKLDNGTTLTDREMVAYVARQTVDDIIASKYPKVKEKTLMQSDLYEAADSLAKRRKDKVGVPIPLTNGKLPLPSETIYRTTDFLGRLLAGE